MLGCLNADTRAPTSRKEEAIGVSAMIIAAALEMAALDKWRKDDSSTPKVFEGAAPCSITLTAEGFDLRDFNEALEVQPDES